MVDKIDEPGDPAAVQMDNRDIVEALLYLSRQNKQREADIEKLRQENGQLFGRILQLEYANERREWAPVQDEPPPH
ncbi:MAG: hypothetical protein ABSA13_14210 [Beijerinckiaceae bacterium]|jgi:hypothetical protein